MSYFFWHLCTKSIIVKKYNFYHIKRKIKNSNDKGKLISDFIDNLEYIDLSDNVINYKNNLYNPDFNYRWIIKFQGSLKKIVQEQVKNPSCFNKSNEYGVVLKLSFQSLDNVDTKLPTLWRNHFFYSNKIIQCENG